MYLYMRYTAYLLLFGITGGCTGSMNSYDKFKSIPNIDLFCSDVKICSSPKRVDDDFTPALPSCCKECSCDEFTCEYTNSCCFPKKPITETTDRQQLQQCIYTQTRAPDKSGLHLLMSYLVVLNSPDNTNHASSPDVACCDEDVAPWGSLYPVFSYYTNLIYKNSRCAECNGVRDWVVWDVFLECDLEDSSGLLKFNLEDHFQAMYSNKTSKHCQFRFTHPGDLYDIQYLQCFRDAVDSCNLPTFEIPYGNVTRDAIVKACTSGLFSPYVSTEIYANVFCSICNGGFSTACQDHTSIGRSSSSYGFTALIDTNFAKSQKTADGNLNLPTVCTIVDGRVDNSSCKGVRCPSGQVRYEEGSDCVFATTVWFYLNLRLNIRLTPRQTIERSYLESLVSNDLAKDLKWLKHPWKGKWAITNIYLESIIDPFQMISDPKFILNSILLELSFSVDEIYPQNLLEQIDQKLNTKCTMNVNGLSIKLSQTLLEYQEHKYGGRNRYIPGWKYQVISRGGVIDGLNITFPYFSDIIGYQTTQTFDNNFLTKLFFCPQVELTDMEYSLFANNNLLLVKRTEKVLRNGEFEIGSNGRKQVVRICVQDSGLEHTYKVSASDILRYRGYIVIHLVLGAILGFL